MAGTRKTIYLSELATKRFNLIKKYCESKLEQNWFEKILTNHHKMIYSKISGISDGAYIALSRGKFEDLTSYTDSNGNKVITIKEDVQKKYKKHITKMIDSLNFIKEDQS